MPIPIRVWLGIRRLIGRPRNPVAAAPGAVSADGALGFLQSIRHRFDEFCERMEEQVQERRKRELQRQEAIRKERRAKRRSLTLLMRLMNQEQRREFRKSAHFHVVGGSTGVHYRIRVDRIANIDVLRGDGTVKHRLCVHPTGGVPIYDVMAGQMLHLQDGATEQRLLQQANIHPARPEDSVPSRLAWFT